MAHPNLPRRLTRLEQMLRPNEPVDDGTREYTTRYQQAWDTVLASMRDDHRQQLLPVLEHMRTQNAAQLESIRHRCPGPGFYWPGEETPGECIYHMANYEVGGAIYSVGYAPSLPPEVVEEGLRIGEELPAVIHRSLAQRAAASSGPFHPDHSCEPHASVAHEDSRLHR